MNEVTNNEKLLLKALAGLYYVDDPEVGLNIVDLGLIYEINFDEDKKLMKVIMTLTTQFCPMGDEITQNTMGSLTEDFPEWDIDLEMTFDPPWDQSKISPEGIEFLTQ
ncbi:MAG: metal-sulfur cluster assembly factor [Chitinophagales bacterium]|nr:metal-sulfur cluster assembly factor [Chitinophagales bacterium]